jgi:phosphoglucosamine mutase
VISTLPQVLLNVPGVDRERTDDPELVAAVTVEQGKLGETGRILLRPSGTEPLVRVMVEAGSPEEAAAVAGRLADVVRRRLAL